MVHNQGADSSNPSFCPLPQAPDFSGVTRIEQNPRPPLGDYLAAMRLADTEAGRRVGS